jgi:hypothetical protein
MWYRLGTRDAVASVLFGGSAEAAEEDGGREKEFYYGNDKYFTVVVEAEDVDRGMADLNTGALVLADADVVQFAA